MKWLKGRIQKHYALEVLRELLSASIQQAIDAEVQVKQLKIELNRWATAREEEWLERSVTGKLVPYTPHDEQLYRYVLREVRS